MFIIIALIKYGKGVFRLYSDVFIVVVARCVDSVGRIYIDQEQTVLVSIKIYVEAEAFILLQVRHCDGSSAVIEVIQAGICDIAAKSEISLLIDLNAEVIHLDIIAA